MTYLEMQIKSANSAMGNLHIKDGYFCHECNNKGIVFKARGEELVSAKCKCLEIRKSLRVLKESGIGQAIEKKTFDNFKVEEEWQGNMKELCLRFLNQSCNRAFFIGGQCGCGKTHLCTAMCGHYIREGKAVRYLVWPKEVKTLKALLNEREYDRHISAFINTEVLYIDDFFKQRQGSEPTSADVNIAFEILNARLCDPNKITIISSELVFDTLLTYDEGTISRIAELAGIFLLNICKDRDKNYRLKTIF
ncbi:MAG: hypothetical protein E7596_04210 [Ruminococcaceae bacterium]|nr:hypothetical protein [Oscillospiraceae bacterium]